MTKIYGGPLIESIDWTQWDPSTVVVNKVPIPLKDGEVQPKFAITVENIMT